MHRYEVIWDLPILTGSRLKRAYAVSKGREISQTSVSLRVCERINEIYKKIVDGVNNGQNSRIEREDQS